MAQSVRQSKRFIRKEMRVEARLDAGQKRRIERAANLRGTSVSEFMISSADQAARKTIEQHEVWTLSDRDREVFIKALLRPPAPNVRIKAAVRRYRKHVISV